MGTRGAGKGIIFTLSSATKPVQSHPGLLEILKSKGLVRERVKAGVRKGGKEGIMGTDHR